MAQCEVCGNDYDRRLGHLAHTLLLRLRCRSPSSASALGNSARGRGPQHARAGLVNSTLRLKSKPLSLFAAYLIRTHQVRHRRY